MKAGIPALVADFPPAFCSAVMAGNFGDEKATHATSAYGTFERIRPARSKNPWSIDAYRAILQSVRRPLRGGTDVQQPAG